MITFGTNPGMGITSLKYPQPVLWRVATYQKSLNYMGYNEGESMIGKEIDFVLSAAVPMKD